MKILLLTDSLGLPRSKPEICAFEKTWPFLLKSTNLNTHQVSIGAATAEVLLKQANYYKAFQPEIVILQVGIVDCAPRFMSQKELDFTGALGSCGKAVRFLLNKKWIRKFRQISYLNESKFKYSIEKIKAAFDCPVIAIGILPASEEYEKLLPGVTKKITSYNKILQHVFQYFIETNEIKRINGIMSDHHHLNKVGHLYIFRKVEKFLKDFNPSL